MTWSYSLYPLGCDFSHSYFYSIKDPFWAIQTPIILNSSEGVSRSILCGPAGVWRNRSSSLSDNYHLPDFSHLKFKRYHLVFVALTCPPVDWDSPENRSNPYLDSLVLSLVGVLVDVYRLIMIGSSTKQYPTKFSSSFLIQNLNTALWPASQGPLKSGMLTISHISVAALLPWTMPWGGVFSGTSHLSHP